MQQLELFEQTYTPTISLEEVFAAYYDCRKNKRRSLNALRFEMNLEEELVRLWRDLNHDAYKIGRSVAFLVYQPVIREVFAANFRDRIVHHLVIRKLLPVLDAAISQHSYSCRTGMGTLYGVKKIYEYVRDCSKNYTRNCWVLKMDIRGFFTHIQHHKLYRMLADVIHRYYVGHDKILLLKLVHQIVHHESQHHCLIRGTHENWHRLPKMKSLFFVHSGQGLPIGNLTSQIFANFYLRFLDKFISMQPGIYYGRYVDDMVVVHQSKAVLLKLITDVRMFLRCHYGLTLHPHKTLLQHYAKGFAFIGAFLLPHRIYAGRHLKQQFFRKIRKMFVMPIRQAISVMNSYFGFLKHYNTLRLRLQGWSQIHPVVPHICLDQLVCKVSYTA